MVNLFWLKVVKDISFSIIMEVDEIMSIRLWNEVNKEEELLKFDF